jgi:hypothetical protein
MGGRRPEGHVTDPRNVRMKEMSRRQRRIEEYSEGGQGPEGAAVPQMEWKWTISFVLLWTSDQLVAETST